MSAAERDWVYLFGPGHLHPDTGESLANRYLVLHGTEAATRKRFVDMFGDAWSHSSDKPPEHFEREFGNVRLPESEWPKGDCQARVERGRQRVADLYAEDPALLVGMVINVTHAIRRMHGEAVSASYGPYTVLMHWGGVPLHSWRHGVELARGALKAWRQSFDIATERVEEDMRW